MQEATGRYASYSHDWEGDLDELGRSGRESWRRGSERTEGRWNDRSISPVENAPLQESHLIPTLAVAEVSSPSVIAPVIAVEPPVAAPGDPPTVRDVDAPIKEASDHVAAPAGADSHDAPPADAPHSSIAESSVAEESTTRPGRVAVACSETRTERMDIAGVAEPS